MNWWSDFKDYFRGFWHRDEKRVAEYLESMGIETSIDEVREWWKVYLVIFEKGQKQRPRFISKRRVEDA